MTFLPSLTGRRQWLTSFCFLLKSLAYMLRSKLTSVDCSLLGQSLGPQDTRAFCHKQALQSTRITMRMRSNKEEKSGSKEHHRHARSPKKSLEAKKSKRDISNSSIDSRTEDIDPDEEKDLLGVVEDVRGFLSRRDGIPTYISRQQIVHELCRVTNAPSIDSETKVEAIDFTWLLIEKAKDVREASACLEVALPTVVSQLGSSGLEKQQAAIRFLQKGLERHEHSKQVIGHVIRNGINRKRDSVSIETMKLLPGLYMSNIKHLNLEPVIVAIYEELDKKERENFAFGALLRHQEVLGHELFEEYSDSASRMDRKKFKQLSESAQNRDEIVGDVDGELINLRKKRPKNGTSFGIIPNLIINRAIDKTNRHERAEGSSLLRKELEKNRDNLEELIPYLGGFIKFLGTLLYDSSPKVILQTLACHEILLKYAGHNCKNHADQIAFNLMKISLESKPQIKSELYHVMKKLMKSVTPMVVVDILLQEMDHKNPRMREDILIYIIFALLTFPSNDFNLEEMATSLAPTLADPKRRVRQASLECFALLETGLAPKRTDAIYAAIEDADFSMYDDMDIICDAVSFRLGRKLLAKITEEGFVEYGLIIPPNYYARNIYSGRGKKNNNDQGLEGADVNWILKGTGGLSKGTAGNTLGVNGSAGSMGSTISLQSLKSGTGSSFGGRDRSEISEMESKGNRRGSTTFTRKSRIPSIKGRKARSASPTREEDERVDLRQSSSFNEEAPIDLDIDEEETTLRKKYGFRPIPEIKPPEVTEEQVEDFYILEHWKNDERDMSKDEIAIRKEKYSTISKLQSILDLKAAAASPNEKRSAHVVPEGDDEGRKNLKKESLRTMGLAKDRYRTLFDEEDGMDESEAPGAFKDPMEAYKMAKKDLKSEQWQTEIDGLDALVRLVKYHKEIIIEDVKYVVAALLHECRNLRSQVTRAAIQALIHMFIHLGRDMEVKGLDDMAQLLLTKTGDTNRFIRKDANLALEALAHNITVYRAAQTLGRAGVEHKNTVARTCVARLFADMVERIGPDRLLDDREEQTLESFLHVTSVFLQDGSIDTRTEAKRTIAVFRKQPKLDEKLERVLHSKKEVEELRRALEKL